MTATVTAPAQADADFPNADGTLPPKPRTDPAVQSAKSLKTLATIGVVLLVVSAVAFKIGLSGYLLFGALTSTAGCCQFFICLPFVLGTCLGCDATYLVGILGLTQQPRPSRAMVRYFLAGLTAVVAAFALIVLVAAITNVAGHSAEGAGGGKGKDKRGGRR